MASEWRYTVTGPYVSSGTLASTEKPDSLALQARCASAEAR